MIRALQVVVRSPKYIGTAALCRELLSFVLDLVYRVRASVQLLSAQSGRLGEVERPRLLERDVGLVHALVREGHGEGEAVLGEGHLTLELVVDLETGVDALDGVARVDLVRRRLAVDVVRRLELHGDVTRLVPDVDGRLLAGRVVVDGGGDILVDVRHELGEVDGHLRRVVSSCAAVGGVALLGELEGDVADLLHVGLHREAVRGVGLTDALGVEGEVARLARDVNAALAQL